MMSEPENLKTDVPLESTLQHIQCQFFCAKPINEIEWNVGKKNILFNHIDL